MEHLMNVGNGKKVTYKEWVARYFTEPNERAALMDALAAFAGPVSLEKFRKDFCELSDADRKEFMKTMQDSINFAHSAMAEDAFDRALQADLDRRNKEAYGAAWEKSAADAKARGEQARREALGDIDAAIKAETDKLKQGAAR